MMQVPDHLSVTGAPLMQLDPFNRLMNKFESTRKAVLEKMSVPEHITINGNSTFVPEERKVFRSASLRMEVPNHLNVFDLSQDMVNHNNNIKMIAPQSIESSNVANPYEEVKLMQKRMGVLMEQYCLLESQLLVQKRREKGLILLLIGAVLHIAYTYLRR